MRRVIAFFLLLVSPTAAAPQSGLGREVIFQRITEACQGSYAAEPGAIIESDLDGDGRYDYVLQWSMIRCTSPAYLGPQTGAGFCGMQLCTADIYASSVWRPGSYPQGILNVGLEAWPGGSPHPLRTRTVRAECPGGVCTVDWRWNGAELEPVR